jgi:acetylornithine deacetylase/succinyl-diaminopimelate desuccinylase-like protein
MARIAAVVADLMLASRVRTALEASGHEVEQDSELPDELDGIDLLVADLDAVSPEALGNLGIPVIGFYQHTDTAMKTRADEAGLSITVPRSRMVRELPELVERGLA